MPALTYGTAFFSHNLPYPRGGRFLEMGCGAGVTAVCAGQAGCEDVLAVDVDPQAVATTMRNAARHDVFQVRGKAGGVFAALDAQDGPFDLIFWALPYENVAAGSPAASAETRCVLDVGHYCCRTYGPTSPAPTATWLPAAAYSSGSVTSPMKTLCRPSPPNMATKHAWPPPTGELRVRTSTTRGRTPAV